MILAILMMLLIPSWAWSATYYVATNGDNANDGLSEEAPKATIAHCVSLMVAGDTCLVRGGTYNSGTIGFRRSGTSTQPIRLAAYPGENPIINFTGGIETGSTVTRIEIIAGGAQTNLVGWITIEGFEIRNGYEGIKTYSSHDITIRNNYFHDNGQGILGYGIRWLVEKNIFYHGGAFDECNEGAGSIARCNGDHHIYFQGSDNVFRRNIFYQGLASNIQINGSSGFDPTKHPTTQYAYTQNWIIDHNTIAYSDNSAGIIIWGANVDGLRLENNIIYENRQISCCSSQTTQAINATASASGSTGMLFRNNWIYGTLPAGTLFHNTAIVDGVNYTQSGNSVNTGVPGFVDAPAATTADPDFSLTSTASVIATARVNEFPQNATLTAGAFDAVGTPTASITTNKITLIFPMNNAVPIQNLSTTGVSVACTGSACPGSPTVNAVSRQVGTDTHVEVAISGITGDACEAANQTWTISYNSATGTWTGNDNIGPYPGLHQKIFSFTNLAVTNQCTGSGPPTEPGTPYIHYLFDEGAGTTATNSGSLGAGGNGTLQNGVTWATGGGVTLTAQSTQHIEVPYGNGVNPTTQDLTIAFEVEIPAGNESLSRSYFGSALGTNQRFYISTASGTWRLGAQASSDSTASDLSVSAGRNHLCLTVNATTDTLTLHKNGVASTSAGAVKTVTSYTLSGDFDLGRIAGLTNGGGGTFRHFVVYQSVEDCNAIYEAAQTPPPPVTGTLAQAAIQFQAVYLAELGGSPTNLGALNAAKDVVAGGAVAPVFQIHCENVADCDPTAFKLTYKRNGSGTRLPLPNTETADGIWFWGASNEPFLNSGITTTRLTGSCTVTNGATQLTADQVPNVDLPQDGCVMLRYIVRVRTAGDYFDLALQTENGIDLTGGYDAEARINVIGSQASGAH